MLLKKADEAATGNGEFLLFRLVVDSYGDINIEDATASSASQIVSLLLEEVKDTYSLNEQGARALYMGIIGDTNRFMYRSTDERTFKAASYLLE